MIEKTIEKAEFHKTERLDKLLSLTSLEGRSFRDKKEKSLI